MRISETVHASTRAAAMAALLSGCSTAGGLLVADVHRTDGALVVALEGFGATVRGVRSDAGLTLGYDRRVYVYPARVEDAPEEGRHYFVLALPKSVPVLIDTRSLGLDLRASAVELGVTMGYRASSVLVRPRADSGMYMRFRYTPAALGATQLMYCSEENPCWPIALPEGSRAQQ